MDNCTRDYNANNLWAEDYKYRYPFVSMSSGLEVGSRARVISKQKQEVESTRQGIEILAGGALMMIAKAAP